MNPETREDTTTNLSYDGPRPVLVVNAARLLVASGPDQNASCPLELRRVRVGSAPDNNLVLTDPQVSRHHLELQVEDTGYRVVDLKSSNGTYFQTARIRDVRVNAGAEIHLGNTVLRIVPDSPSSRAVEPADSFGRLIGASPAMQSLYGLLRRVAPSDVTVLLEGETGTGKELVAEELHNHSSRRDGPFHVVDCGALSAGLVESELFGHVKGAFTGALGDRKGVFERGHGGTVFLDEIGELPQELQTRLLRVLDRRTVRRVGDSLDRRVDVRIVAATNRDLTEEVAAGRFRSDLFYRLAVLRLVVPPLRDRLEDLELLARHFLWEAGCADPDGVLLPGVMEALHANPWRGNVRELRNHLQRAALLALDGGAADQLDLGQQAPQAEHLVPGTDAGDDRDTWLPRLMMLPYKEARQLLLDRFDATYARHLLERHGNNISRMAVAAAVDRQVVRRLLRSLPGERP